MASAGASGIDTIKAVVAPMHWHNHLRRDASQSLLLLGVGVFIIERLHDAELHGLNLAKKPKVGTTPLLLAVKAAAADDNNNREQPTKNIGVERRRGEAAAAATTRAGFIFLSGACCLAVAASKVSN